MRRTCISLYLAAALVTCLVAPLAAEEVFGEGVSIQEATPIASILDEPEAWLGKPVRVDGVVSAVCEKMGCWIALADPVSGQSIQFKVEDGVIVFPLSAKGKRASAQGALERIPEDDDHAMDAVKHEAHAGKHEGHARIKYRMRATGALVY